MGGGTGGMEGGVPGGDGKVGGVWRGGLVPMAFLLYLISLR